MNCEVCNRGSKTTINPLQKDFRLLVLPSIDLGFTLSYLIEQTLSSPSKMSTRSKISYKSAKVLLRNLNQMRYHCSCASYSISSRWLLLFLLQLRPFLILSVLCLQSDHDQMDAY